MLDNLLELEREIASQISKVLRLGFEVDELVQVVFRITDDGHAYDLKLVDGSSDPFAIRSALNAILIAGPYAVAEDISAKVFVTCTLEGNHEQPTVRVNIQENSLDEIDGDKIALQQIPHNEKSYKDDSIARNWMFERLEYLLKCLFEYPDSPIIQAEIDKVFPFYLLNSSDANDWLSYARSHRHEVVPKEHPNKDEKDDPRVAIAALFQALRLSNDRSLLFELSDAYAKKIAYDVLTVSGGDPLLLGTAAVLADQYSDARTHYELASQDGDSRAMLFLQRLLSAVGGSEDSVSDQKTSFRLQGQPWETLLRLLPPDTEMIIKSGPIKPIMEVPRPKPGDKSRRAISVLADFAVPIPTYSKREEVKAILESGTIELAIFAGRFGALKGAGITVFDKEYLTLADQIMDLLRPKSVLRKFEYDTEILVFDHKPKQWPNWARDTKYVCSPAPGVLVVADERHYLREFLGRLKKTPSDRALPDYLPQWEALDNSADTWAIRSFKNSHLAFDWSSPTIPLGKSEKEGDEEFFEYYDRDAIGFAISELPNEKIRIAFYSGNKSSLEVCAEKWKRIIYDYCSVEDDAGQVISRTTPRIDLNAKQNSLIIEVDDFESLSFPLLLGLGFPIGI